MLTVTFRCFPDFHQGPAASFLITALATIVRSPPSDVPGLMSRATGPSTMKSNGYCTVTSEAYRKNFEKPESDFDRSIVSSGVKTK